MKTGFIPLRRKFFNHNYWLENRKFSRAEAWLDMIAMATFHESQKRTIQGKTLEIKRGELIASVRFLSKRWRWSNERVNRYMDELQTSTMITTRMDRGIRVTKLCNYDTYNNYKFELDSLTSTATSTVTSTPTSTPTSTATSTNTIKKKKENKENKEKQGVLFDVLPFDSIEFKQLWSDWAEHLIQKKVDRTEQAKKQQINKLFKMGESRAIEALKYSIAGNYQGIFEDKNQQQGQNGTATGARVKYAATTAEQHEKGF